MSQIDNATANQAIAGETARHGSNADRPDAHLGAQASCAAPVISDANDAATTGSPSHHQGSGVEATSSTVICVCCPCGCEMTVHTDDEGRVLDVQGNECARGRAHAEDEVIAPVRVLTMSLCVAGALEPLSVKTAAPIPKSLMSEARVEIENAARTITLPIESGSVVMGDVCNTGIPVIATKALG